MCVDLISCFRNPFAPKDKRLKKYIAWCFIALVILIPNTYPWLNVEKDEFDIYKFPLLYNDEEFIYNAINKV